MNKIVSLLVVVGVLGLMAGCGGGALNEAKAQKVIVDQLTVIISETIQKAGDDQEAVQKLTDQKGKMAQLVTVDKVTVTGETATAEATLKAGEQDASGMKAEFKLTKTDSGWKADQFKMSTGDWVAFDDYFRNTLGSALNKGKQVATMGDLRSINTAIQSYLTDNYKAPEGDSLKAVESELAPFHIQVLPLQDAWGKDFFYKAEGENYQVRSAGPDGIMEAWDAMGDDIVVMNGDFIESASQLASAIEEWNKPIEESETE